MYLIHYQIQYTKTRHTITIIYHLFYFRSHTDYHQVEKCRYRRKGMVDEASHLPLNFWRRNYFFLILAHPVYKM